MGHLCEFLHTLFQSEIYDVIDMRQRKKLSEGKLQIQYFIFTIRDTTPNVSVRFSGHFRKSTDLGRNFKTRTVSLRILL